MATNKHATIRYHALDRCFSNYGRKFFMEDLINACNDALYDFAGIEDGVKRRQVFDDIAFMESEQGWSIELDRLKDGKKVYYRYSDRNFSIKNTGINQSEAEQLKETLSILSRFKGLPQFDWVDEMQIRLEDTFKLKGNLQTVVSFEQNPFLKGLSHFTPLFQAIQNKTALNIQYQGFKQEAPSLQCISPWHLKQYNNRWFLFGWNHQYKTLTNLALDRIIEVLEAKAVYVPNVEIDFEEYFDDVVGVSVRPEAPVEKVVLKVAVDTIPYIESKPLHGSQKIKPLDQEYKLIELTVQLNHELKAMIFSYLDAIEVIEPDSFRTSCLQVAEVLFHKYQKPVQM